MSIFIFGGSFEDFAQDGLVLLGKLFKLSPTGICRRNWVLGDPTTVCELEKIFARVCGAIEIGYVEPVNIISRVRSRLTMLVSNKQNGRCCEYNSQQEDKLTHRNS